MQMTKSLGARVCAGETAREQTATGLPLCEGWRVHMMRGALLQLENRPHSRAAAARSWRWQHVLRICTARLCNWSCHMGRGCLAGLSRPRVPPSPLTSPE
jgi:hypothetical protein